MRALSWATLLQFNETINLWPNVRELWRDLSADHDDLAYETVRSWRNRNSIPSQYWDAIVRAARARRFVGVTYETLSHAASQRGQSKADEPKPMATAA